MCVCGGGIGTEGERGREEGGKQELFARHHPIPHATVVAQPVTNSIMEKIV